MEGKYVLVTLHNGLVSYFASRLLQCSHVVIVIGCMLALGIKHYPWQCVFWIVALCWLQQIIVHIGAIKWLELLLSKDMAYLPLLFNSPLPSAGFSLHSPLGLMLLVFLLMRKICFVVVLGQHRANNIRKLCVFSVFLTDRRKSCTSILVAWLGSSTNSRRRKIRLVSNCWTGYR